MTDDNNGDEREGETIDLGELSREDIPAELLGLIELMIDLKEYADPEPDSVSHRFEDGATEIVLRYEHPHTKDEVDE